MIKDQMILIVLIIGLLFVSVQSFSINYPISCGQPIPLNYAEIQFNSSITSIALYGINSECEDCSNSLISNIQTNDISCATVYTPFPWILQIVEQDTNQVIYTKDHLFGEQGSYNLFYNGEELSIDIIQKPINSNQSLWILLLILSFVIALSFILPTVYEYLYNKYYIKYTQSNDIYAPLDLNEPISPSNETSNSNNENSRSDKPKKAARLQSLDTFRGFALYLMIFVNYGGGGYWFFDHSDWNGLTFADLLFPWFMFMMGVSMALSYKAMDNEYNRSIHNLTSSLTQTQYQYELFFKATKRSLIFFALGLFLSNGFHYNIWRMTGVLQYFAFSYFMTSVTLIICKKLTIKSLKIIEIEIENNSKQNKSEFSILNINNSNNNRNIIQNTYNNLIISNDSTVRVFWAYRYEWIIQLSILFIYFFICVFGQAPGCPVGYNGPGGLSDDSKHVGCTGGIHYYIDTLLFTSKHFFHKPTCKLLYNCG